VSTDHDWPARFETELVRLGLQPVRARQLREETVQQAAESAAAGTLACSPGACA
jgi:hypothetical protein